MGGLFRKNVGGFGQLEIRGEFDPRLSVPKADLIVSLLPAMIEAPVTAYGYRLPALKLLAMLIKEYGAKIRTLLLLGEHVLQHPAAPVPVALPADVLAMAAGYAASFSVQSLPGLEGVSVQLKRQSRLWLKVTIGNALQAQEVLERVRTSEGVEYAEMYPAMTVPPLVAGPEDPVMSFTKTSGSGLPNPDWPVTTFLRGPLREWNTPTYRIAVLDSGCDGKHPSLTGCVDYGSTESRLDGYGHGTFVCGILAAKTVEAKAAGVDTSKEYYAPVQPGVTPGAKVLAFNIFNPEPLKSEKVVLGKPVTVLTYTIDPSRYFTGMSMIADPNRTGRWKDISVVNMSIRYDGTDSATEKKWLDALATANVAVVAASGNADRGSGNNVMLVNPALHASSLAVGAVDVNVNVWTGTHMGKSSRPLDICAPGVSVLSALPLAPNALGRVFSGRMTGTSAAAPFVTAAVAMLQEIRKVKDRSRLLDALRDSTAPPAKRLLRWKA
jgi:subtilisin family serine protease